MKFSDDFEFEDEEFGQEDDGMRFKPWMLTVFAIMLLIAVLICIPLWRLTHRAFGEEQTGEVVELQPTSIPQPVETPATVPTAEPTIAPTAVPTAEPTAVPTAEPAVAPTATPTAEPTAAPTAVSTAESATVPTEAPTTSSTVPPTDAGMAFTPVNESVTAKNVTNLRSVPTTEDGESVVAQLHNGESAVRVGVNADTGWSKLEYDGRTVYAVSQYLTTDLEYETPKTPANPNRVSTKDGRVIIFVDCSDNITPKEYVNLRVEPSTSEGDSTIRCQLYEDEVVHRTGYSEESGWSRVEYNGEILYVVSSYMKSAD